MCRTLVTSPAASLQSLVHRRHMASLSFFYRYYFAKCSSELAQLVPLHFSRGVPLLILIDSMNFLLPFLNIKRTSMSTIPFFAKLGPGYSLPIECFSLTYDLNRFRSRDNRHLVTVSFFLRRFPLSFNHFALLLLVAPCLVVAAQSCIG